MDDRLRLTRLRALFSIRRPLAHASVLRFVAAILLLSGVVCAEDLPSIAPGQPETQLLPKTSAQQAAPEASVDEGHERILFVVPAFGITNRQDAPPLTPKQKFSLAARQALDPFVWVSSAIQAGATQAGGEFPEYGRGMAGFSKSYGAAMADAINGGLVSTAFCVVLKQDPRFFRLGQGSIKHRVLYAFEQEISTKTDKGTRQFNWSNVLGTVASSAISNAYYPAQDRGLGLTLNRSGVSLLWGLTGELADEFWPDVDRKFFHRKPKTAQ